MPEVLKYCANTVHKLIKFFLSCIRVRSKFLAFGDFFFSLRLDSTLVCDYFFFKFLNRNTSAPRTNNNCTNKVAVN